MVVWPHHRVPKHTIAIVSSGQSLVTGSASGQLCVWEQSDAGSVLEVPLTTLESCLMPFISQPKLFLCGHTDAVTALAMCYHTKSYLNQAIVSASRDGTLAVWDPSDGRAISSLTSGRWMPELWSHLEAAL